MTHDRQLLIEHPDAFIQQRVQALFDPFTGFSLVPSQDDWLGLTGRIQNSQPQHGAVQLDMAGAESPSVTIRPNLLPYHLNKGGVAYHRVRVMKTVTVIGRLLDGQGMPLKGAMVVNHAGRTVSEADGFFAVEMSERNPSLQVEYQGSQQCNLALDTAQGRMRFDSVYPALGSRIRSELAVSAGAKADPSGCLEVDDHQRTSVPGLFAAGDVVKGLDQISHAMGEAGVAATTIRNLLNEQRPIRR